jgi:hypothetical protein
MLLRSPIPLNSFFPEDSASTDSDEDLAKELDELFRFMFWSDLSGEKEAEESSFIEDEEREGNISARDLFPEIDDFDDIITDDSDDDGDLPQVSDNRVKLTPSAPEARYGFLCKPGQKLAEDVYS